MTSPSYRWHIITGEYPPQPGGVSDYTRSVAKGLVEAGDEVTVWAPECEHDTPRQDGILIHRLPGCFGPRALSRLTAQLKRERSEHCRLLVQYVPQMYGWKAMNLPFCLWLYGHRCHGPWVMFHEVAVDISAKQEFRYNIIGVVTHLMASIVARSAKRIYISIPYWKKQLGRIAPTNKPVTWLPVPSSIANDASPQAVEEVRKRLLAGADRKIVGHFGTYGLLTAECLVQLLPRVLQSDQSIVVLLLGRNSEQFAEQLLQHQPHFSDHVIAAGAMSAEDIAIHLKACDLLLQPYLDGVSSRRTSIMAGLALGIPIVTNKGKLTEPVWDQGFVALTDKVDVQEQANLTVELLDDSRRRQALAAMSAEAYQEYFSIKHTIETLRSAVSSS